MDDSPGILIVDDDTAMAQSTAAVLGASGYENIDILNDAPAAVAHINANDYDLVLLDVRMPGMTGFELLDAIDRDDLHTSFIIMTGDSSEDTALQALRRGASDYIRKPADPDELLIRVERALQQQSLQIANRKMQAETHSLQNQLRQSQKMEAIGALAGGVAHDFNNILAIILGNTELSRKMITIDHPVQENLDQIQLASKRARELINQLLTFSRKTDTGWKPLELNSVITECLTLLRASIPSNIIINHEIAGSSYFIQGDATQIHQIVINLCTNAAHAMEEHGGLLDVSLQAVTDAQSMAENLAPGSYIKLSVADTGSGIDGKILSRIFDPYFTTKAFGHGTGMGLAVVHGIVQNHGGEIRVASKPNIKTEFEIFLPLVEAQVVDDVAREDDIALDGNGRVLLVDDESMVVDVMSRMLKQLGYEVVSCTDSRVALATFEQSPSRFDVVITDMTMPGMTGDKLAECIREVRPELPILLSSGYNDIIDQDEIQSSGVNSFLSKPTTMKDLAEKLTSLLTASSRERRRHRRFVLGGGAFVIFDSRPDEKNALLDVSESGLAVNCSNMEHQRECLEQLSIYLNEHLGVGELPCETVSDLEDESSHTHRYGFRFDKLTPDQSRQLGQFLENHGLEKH
jgi:signal transduction histidine kinase